ncbi:hypothetical protein ABN028_14570 [Actinopolymorpha sp. B17G11]|uniref:hypothetical protein n=1 Tax=unclassified Actinopolymorpha TaxID=2627063 RepID=UPI0032D971A8
MTRHASFKKVVRRHAEQTGQRYTGALTDLEGLGARMDHVPAADRLLAHLRDRYEIDATAATKLSLHATYVFRIDRNDGDPWIARAFHPARPRAGTEGDAAILRFLERHDNPAEALGDDPSREGSPRQDLLASLSFLDAADTKVAEAHRKRFEQLRDQVRAADDAHGLPEALLHGNLMASPDHVVVTEQGPVAIHWMGSGRGPRLADFAYLMWGTWLNEEAIDAGVNAYSRHIELTDDELDRLEAVMRKRPLYLMAYTYRRHIDRHHDGGAEVDWKWFNPEYIHAAAAATRAAFRR